MLTISEVFEGDFDFRELDIELPEFWQDRVRKDRCVEASASSTAHLTALLTGERNGEAAAFLARALWQIDFDETPCSGILTLGFAEFEQQLFFAQLSFFELLEPLEKDS